MQLSLNITPGIGDRLAVLAGEEEAREAVHVALDHSKILTFTAIHLKTIVERILMVVYYA